MFGFLSNSHRLQEDNFEFWGALKEYQTSDITVVEQQIHHLVIHTIHDKMVGNYFSKEFFNCED